jgi:hypothetical protein
LPILHFNSRSGDTTLPDVEGEELPDLAAARRVAIASARETIVEAVKAGDTPPDHIQITDSEGCEVGIVPIIDVLQGK